MNIWPHQSDVDEFYANPRDPDGGGESEMGARESDPHFTNMELGVCL